MTCSRVIFDAVRTSILDSFSNTTMGKKVAFVAYDHHQKIVEWVLNGQLENPVGYPANKSSAKSGVCLIVI